MMMQSDPKKTRILNHKSDDDDGNEKEDTLNESKDKLDQHGGRHEALSSVK